MKASEADDVLVPGNPNASRLFLLASHADEPVMPPEENDVSAAAMTPMEVALLRRWINLGANVDQVSTEESLGMSPQPLPLALRTVFAAAITPDGRMAAVSFGSDVRVFGSASTDPIGSLTTVDGNSVGPAHEDFVQDLILDPAGTRIITAGFRNVKFWELSPFEPISIPMIRNEDVWAIAMNSRGSHLAILLSTGEVSVAEIGKDRWQWTKGSVVPDNLQRAKPPKVRIVLDQTGRNVLVGWEKSLRVVCMEAGDSETMEFADDLTSIVWRDPQRFVVGDATGRVTFLKRQEDVWVTEEQSVFDEPVAMLLNSPHQPDVFAAIDASGKIAKWNVSKTRFEGLGKLPEPAVSASLTSAGDAIWVATEAGTIGKFSLSDKKYTTLSKVDPVAEDRYANHQWETLVGERLVAASDKEMKQAEANVKGEQANLGDIQKDIEKNTKLRDEKLESVTASKNAAVAAAQKLADARLVEKKSIESRKQLSETLRQLEASISNQEKQLADLKKKKSELEKKLATVPDAKQTAEAVKSASNTADKAKKNAEEKEAELRDAVAGLEIAEQNRSRGETRLKSLEAEAGHQKTLFGQAKTAQENRKAIEATAKSVRDQSKATDRALAIVGANDHLLTHSETSGAWSLWSDAGDWIGELPELNEDTDLIAAGRGCVLVKGADGQPRALRASQHTWQQARMIGSPSGKSPFADRVLCIDVDPTGRLLATGGGEPARSGELMIWDTADGSLVRRIEMPHSDTILCVGFSPDGKTLASGSADRMIKLWDVQSGSLLQTLEGHTHHVTTIAWNVNHRQLASGSADATVKVWDVESGQSKRTISGLKSEVTRLVFVGRDDRIGVTCGDSHFRVYRTDNGTRETNAKVVGGYLYALDANRDGTKFVIGGADGNAKLVDKSGKQLQQYKEDE